MVWVILAVVVMSCSRISGAAILIYKAKEKSEPQEFEGALGFLIGSVKIQPCP